MCSVRQQNILVICNRHHKHHKQSQHVRHTDVVDRSLQGQLFLLVLFTVPTGGTTARPERVFTTTATPRELSTPSDWLFAANEDWATGDLCWYVSTDELHSSVEIISLLSSSRMTIGGSAEERTCFDAHRWVVPSFNCMSYDLKGSVCLGPFAIHHWCL